MTSDKGNDSQDKPTIPAIYVEHGNLAQSLWGNYDNTLAAIQHISAVAAASPLPGFPSPHIGGYGAIDAIRSKPEPSVERFALAGHPTLTREAQRRPDNPPVSSFGTDVLPLKPGEFARAAESVIKQINPGGSVTEQQVKEALHDPRFHGQELQALIALNSQFARLSMLTQQDTIHDTISIEDLKEFDKIRAAYRHHDEAAIGKGRIASWAITYYGKYAHSLKDGMPAYTKEDIQAARNNPNVPQQDKEMLAAVQNSFLSDGVSNKAVSIVDLYAAVEYANRMTVFERVVRDCSALSEVQNGTLFVNKEHPGNSVKVNAVLQPIGVGNCYFESALAAEANRAPEIIFNSIKEERSPDGTHTYTITFQGDKDNPVKVTSAEVYDQILAEPLYVRGVGQFGTWPVVFRLAYYKHRQQDQSCKATDDMSHCIGQGGLSSSVLELLEGSPVEHINLKDWTWEPRNEMVIPILNLFVDNAKNILAQIDQNRTGVTLRQLQQWQQDHQGQDTDAKMTEILIAEFSHLHNLSSPAEAGGRESISAQDVDKFHSEYLAALKSFGEVCDSGIGEWWLRHNISGAGLSKDKIMEMQETAPQEDKKALEFILQNYDEILRVANPSGTTGAGVTTHALVDFYYARSPANAFAFFPSAMNSEQQQYLAQAVIERKLEQALSGSSRHAVTAGTLLPVEDFPGDHAWTVTTFVPDGKGSGILTIRNPRGGQDGTPEGTMEISLERFMRVFADITNI